MQSRAYLIVDPIQEACLACPKVEYCFYIANVKSKIMIAILLLDIVVIIYIVPSKLCLYQ